MGRATKMLIGGGLIVGIVMLANRAWGAVRQGEAATSLMYQFGLKGVKVTANYDLDISLTATFRNTRRTAVSLEVLALDLKSKGVTIGTVFHNYGAQGKIAGYAETTVPIVLRVTKAQLATVLLQYGKNALTFLIARGAGKAAPLPVALELTGFIVGAGGIRIPVNYNLSITL